ncbi:glycosyltransferase family 4 protein [Thermoleptolyngbya sp. M55_K2018_002]|uniref:glycosyltransferase family 4 protein n=1 Tax=Thermoleptolyngbya sp. M55_K2018_002 TaxID=2747808 RepID=UPI0019DA98EE|nr:glycosyltransferase family 4 protein [Thermoleptolyngbya sp. M55_K2018_002]HIK42337.1 glycosyltransferase family 4 protein [Thermoleptolyngbya sp. M55_K2018_002]
MKVVLLHFCFTEYTVGLANGLANYVDLTLIHPEKISADCRKALDPRVKVRTFAKPRIRDPRNVFAMAEMMRLIREAQPDVLHVQETNDFWYDLTLFFNSMPPLVTTIHDVFRHPGDRDNVWGSEYTRRIAFYKSQALIVHANPLKEALVSQFRVSGDRILVLPHGEIGSFFQKWADGVHLPREPYTLLFFGRIWPYKGLRYLVEAMPLVAERFPDVRLIVAGRGENLSQYFSGEPDPRQFEILNEFIPLKAVAGLFQRSTVTVLPYVESSQSGVAAVAFAMGTPVIASNIGGLAEMVNHGQDGLLVPPGDSRALADAIIHLLSDRALQERFAAAGLARCQTDLNWSNIAASTVEIYQRAIAAKR